MPNTVPARRALAAAVLLFVASCTGTAAPTLDTPPPAEADPWPTNPAPPPSTAPADSSAADGWIDAAVLLAQLPVSDRRSPTPYDRSRFVHWSDLDGDGCTSREAVLIRDGAEVVVDPDTCRVLAGEWYSAYDGTTTADSRQVHIDHLVPLYEAWHSGADTWTAALLEEYANDEPSLIAVSGTSNMAKGAADPAGWLPATDVLCSYLGAWVAVKHRWGLSVDTVEADTLSEAFRTDCSGTVANPAAPLTAYQTPTAVADDG